jgi:alpha-1,3-rhamnosyl/mannosyltransferase
LIGEAPLSLHVLLNARPLNTVFTGVARYVRTLYEHIIRQELARVGFFCRGRVTGAMPLQTGDAMSRHFPVWVRDVARASRMVVEDRLLARHFRGGRFDVYHETGMFPLTTSSAVPTVLSIYDLSLITHPECHPPDRVRHFDRYFYRRLAGVAHIITISEFIRRQILSVLDVPPDRVTAIPLAAAGVFYKRDPRDVRRYLDAIGIGGRYVLTVGTREPRKNLNGLIRAYAEVHTDIPLLCVGWAGWMNEDLSGEIDRLRLKGKVKLLGHVSDEQLALLYSGALLSVYPSLYEGFGLPILESMACECPVVCSDCSSMPEVAGGAAHLIDPTDGRDIARGLGEMLDDEALRLTCIEKGRHRATEFSWERTARETVEVLARLAALKAG